ncbi:MAG TPA: STT3 domain-containing protein [Bryobacteraceae bacterium]|jgi:dolichyl-diphosphooligosaccharide--protein glycosyltransferase
MKALPRFWVTVALAASMAAAFALRVAPAYGRVFTPQGVSFQEGDAWFHLRTVHNLLAHYPWRTGFDPYALYPGGENVPTGPFWDLTIATVAWVAGAGKPSAELVDGIAAWLPAVLGAVFPLAVFWLGRRLFGDAAGLLAACAVAVVPGALLWTSHLGVADHHALESLLALAAIGLMCADRPVAAGLTLGAYLATRPAGIFVPATLAMAAAIHPALARPAMTTVAVAAVAFLPAIDSLWGDYTMLALAVCCAASAGVYAIDALWRRRGWPAAGRPAALLAAGVAAAAAVAIVRPESARSLAAQVTRVANATPQVQELMPLLRSYGSSAWTALYRQLGTLWVAAVPGLVWLACQAWRTRRPALTLFAVWSAVTMAAAFAQVRMTVYYGATEALLAGAACAWLIEAAPARYRKPAAAGLVALLVATNLPAALATVRGNFAPDADWRAALAWLRNRTPEPMGDARAWYAPYPRLPDGGRFAYPGQAYGVGVWWTYGYWLEFLGRRIPSANGTQAGAVETAQFLSDPLPQSAVESMRRLELRYVVIDPSLPLFDMAGGSHFVAILSWAGRLRDDYFRVFYTAAENGLHPVVVYLPDYYRSLAVRLYLYDGRAVEPKNETFVFSTSGAPPIIRWNRRFETQSAAEAFVLTHPAERLTLGGVSPAATCVALEPVEGVHRVFSSDPSPIRPDRVIRAVKVFEVER